MRLIHARLGGAGVDFMSQHHTGAPMDLPQCLLNSEEDGTLYPTHSSKEQNEMQRLTLKESDIKHYIHCVSTIKCIADPLQMSYA